MTIVTGMLKLMAMNLMLLRVMLVRMRADVDDDGDDRRKDDDDDDDEVEERMMIFVLPPSTLARALDKWSNACSAAGAKTHAVVPTCPNQPA